MESRVAGLECEYVLRYEPSPAERRGPTAKALYRHLSNALAARIPALPARDQPGGHFFANGAQLYFEPSSDDATDGFAELNTPECATPRELCAHHLAQDALVREALPAVTDALRAEGYEGRVTALKANVDREGHTFGTSESWLVDDPTPLWLWPVRIPLEAALWLLQFALVSSMKLALLVNAALAAAAYVALGVALLPVSFGSMVLFGERGFQRIMRRWETLSSALMGWLERGRPRVIEVALVLGLTLVLGLHERVLRRTCLRRMQARLIPFLVTRTLLAGNGHVDFARGRRFFRLSSRADRIARLFGCSVGGADKPLLDVKHLCNPFEGWPRRKRLVVLYSDAHLCPKALWLSLAATELVLEAIEGEAFEGAAETGLRDPLRALRAINRDPDLAAQLELANGERLTALAHQRRVLTIVRTYFEARPVTDLRRYQALAAWDATLRALEEAPESLVGELDWVTKRHLCEETAGGPEALAEVADWVPALRLLDRACLTDRDLELGPALLWPRICERMHPFDRRDLEGALDALDRTRLGEVAALGYALRKVDFKFHDLSAEGYASVLAQAGHLAAVSTAAEIERAKQEPPRSTRARARGAAIARARAAGHRGDATWSDVRDKDARETTRLSDPLSAEPEPGTQRKSS